MRDIFDLRGLRRYWEGEEEEHCHPTFEWRPPYKPTVAGLHSPDALVSRFGATAVQVRTTHRAHLQLFVFCCLFVLCTSVRLPGFLSVFSLSLS
eukprot:COSAG05_NODE_4463_length_1504_cov_2.386477_1_plen_93_part_10